MKVLWEEQTVFNAGGMHGSVWCLNYRLRQLQHLSKSQKREDKIRPKLADKIFDALETKSWLPCLNMVWNISTSMFSAPSMKIASNKTTECPQ